MKPNKQYEALLKTGFSCQSDATNALVLFSKKCKYIVVNDIEAHQTQTYLRKGRPAKTDIGIKTFYPRALVCCSVDAFEEKKNCKGRFMIATNELDKERLADQQVLLAYEGHNGVEKSFRFMKDPQSGGVPLVAHTFLLKNQKDLMPCSSL
ncbi:MAG: hypothetical protein EAZ67_14040 [Cytophagales bacterium]|nr:MAG: hypothetical protein EAZ67_14040 [Cytophagales bacterium]